MFTDSEKKYTHIFMLLILYTITVTLMGLVFYSENVLASKVNINTVSYLLLFNQ